MKTEHHLKIWPEFYQRIAMGQKTFDIRKNDRDFQVGDCLLFREFDQKNGYVDHSSELRMEIIYITDFAQQPGFVVMGIKPLPYEKDPEFTPQNYIKERMKNG